MVWQRAFRFTFRLWYGESTSKPFNFAIPFNYSQIHTPQGLHPTVPPDFGTAEIHNWIKRKRAFGVSDWPRKPLFYAFFGGFYPGEGFFYCIKISRNIDPPYNTGNDFVYEDDFAQSTGEYMENSGQYDEAGNRMVTNTESNGRFHTDWLNMLYPRLKIARDLLAMDGVFAISIGFHEMCNLYTTFFGDL